MASQLEIIGEIACSCCGRPTPVKVQKNGLVMVYCTWCGNKNMSYAQKSTEIIKSRMTPNAAEKTPDNTPETVPPEQKPAPKPKAGFWA